MLLFVLNEASVVLLLAPADANVLAQFENMRDTLVNMLCALTDCMNFKCADTF